MAFHNNPRIVTNGLVLCLDANATSSYPGSGTTWTNLGTGGGSASLVGGPSKTSDYGISMSFDGTDDYGQVLSMGAFLPAGDFSVDIAFNRSFTSSAGERYIFYIYNGIRVYFRGSWAGDACYLLRDVNGSSHYGDSAWSGHTGVSISSGDMGAPALQHVCFTLESNSTSGIGRAYKNGALVTTTNLYTDNAGGTNDNGGFETMASSTTGFIATTSAGGSKADCDIGAFKIYNRVLTETEAQQNYNAHKSRFT